MLKLGPEAYFSMREDLAGSFLMTTSIALVCLVAKTGKWGLTEPGAM